MKPSRFFHFAITLLAAFNASAGTKSVPQQTETILIDLPTALRLAGAQNLDVQMAAEKIREAQANRDSAVEKFLPWLFAGATYRAHNHLIQDVGGSVIQADKQSYAPGATLNVQTDLGDAIFKTLEARQLLQAGRHALDAQREESILAAAQGYLDLVKAKSAAHVARDAVRISDDYERQIRRAVSAGIAFKGDALRVKVQTERNQLLFRQAEEQQQIAAAKLTNILHLDPGVILEPRDAEPLPFALVSAQETTREMIGHALAHRPEMKQFEAIALAARESKNGAVYGALIPSMSGQAFVGGLGGGRNNAPHTFGESEDYSASLGWRIGPGGLFDFGQIHARQSRMRGAQLGAEKMRAQIALEVSSARAHVRSLADQLSTAKQVLADAAESYRLNQERKEFGVGVVLETITAEQEMTRARNDYLATVAEYDKAQYALLRALGGTVGTAMKQGEILAR